MKHAILLVLIIAHFHFAPCFAQQQPMRIGIAGLSHSHVHWIFGSLKRKDIELVGIAEPNRQLAERFARQYNFPMSKVYASLEQMLEATQPEGVCAFGSIYDHLQVVEQCAPRGIHVMVEKPLAANMDHARQMQAIVQKHQVQLLTNYETTWYPSNHEAKAMLQTDSIGTLRKIIVNDGHKGPKKIGVNAEFLDWLTDPVLNGGGALMDFGCYGANLATWLHHGRKPKEVTAITHQLQKENNPKVDDEAIILLQYDSSVAVIQASWNWPIGRKDMELFGTKGSMLAQNRHQLILRMSQGYDGFREQLYPLKEREAPFDDPFAWFAAVVRENIKPEAYDLSSLENNMVVMEILEAARQSAKSGKTIKLQ